MESVWLFESGGSKTTVLVSVNGGIQEYSLPAFNPNRPHTAFLNALPELSISVGDAVYFYGSGLADQANQDYLAGLFKKQFSITPRVFHDLLGAARALLGETPGIIMIAGTGAIAGWYDGKEVVDRHGGYGYLIDDIGGGLELGKTMISMWLNNALPSDLASGFEQLTGSNRENFTTTYYHNPQPAIFSKITELVAEYQSDREVRRLLLDYFGLFAHRHLRSLVEKYQRTEVSCCGSVGFYFQDAIREAFLNQGVSLKKVLAKPAHELLDFHLRKGFSSENETI